MMEIIKFFWKKYDYMFGAVFIAITVFIGIYGVKVLDVTYDAWILANYVEWDNVQHYGGWINYRNSPWEFPLGNMSNVAWPDGGNVAYTDSIPLLAVLLKVISPLLPEVFQYAGIFMLFVFILQGITSAMLIYSFTEKKIYSLLGACFFIFSPIMLERGFRHSSLAAHFVILLAMYVFFSGRRKLKTDEKFSSLPWIPMVILSCLSIGITPYLLPMVMIFVLVLTIEFIIARPSKRNVIYALTFFVTNCVVAYITGIVIGSLGQGVNLSGTGYGFYSMNLNAIVNPYSAGKFTWSQFIPVLKQVTGQYDGFNYLGFGMILLLLLVALEIVVCRMRGRENSVLSIKDNIWLLLACLFMTLFATSHIIALNEKVLLEINLPEWLLNLCGIFRASSRMFYPVYYLIFLFAIVMTYRLFNRKKALTYFVLLFFLGLQVYDLKGVLFEKHEYMKTITEYDFGGDEELLELQDYDMLISQTFSLGDDRYLWYISGRNNLLANGSAFASRVTASSQAIVDEEFERIEAEGLNTKYVYVTGNPEVYENWKVRFGEEADFYTWEQSYEKMWFDDMLFMIPKK